MSDYGRLAFTGPVGLALFGVTLDQWWVLVAAVTLVVLGAVALRIGWRRGRSAHAR